MEKDNKRIVINLSNGFRLVAEQSQDPEFRNEIYVGIETDDGVYYQDLAVIRNAYSINENLRVVWNPDILEVLVYADKNDEDYTNKYSVGIREDT
jgi:hypothetical protein